MRIVLEYVTEFSLMLLNISDNMDALDNAIGGVLIQKHHPLAFESYKLKDVNNIILPTKMR